MSHKRNGVATLKDEWETPQWLFDLLDKEFHFDYDLACTHENCKCSHGIFNSEESALTLPWKWLSTKPIVGFLNPPYSAGNIDKFMAKAYAESLKGAVVVCLVPCATDTKWWHNYVMNAQEIRFIKGRVRFTGYDEQGNIIKRSPTFSSCVVIFKQERRQDWEGPRIGETIQQPGKVNV